MYTAKGNGKAGIEAFEPNMHTAVLARLALRADLQRAIEHCEFSIYYQPTVDLRTGRITGFEALIRWMHPNRGMIPPLDFIPLAEETGLIQPIGRWVLREACKQASAWSFANPAEPPLKMAVNLSARQLQDTGLFGDVAAALEEAGLPAEHLVLEITESLLMQDTETVIEKLHELKRLGVRVAIDDFGTGYSSLSYLRRFPVDILKIDKTFVDGLIDRTEGLAVARAIIDLGRALDLETVAEGIETPDQVTELRDLGCRVGQGYYFSRPLTRDAATEILLAPSRRVLPVARGLNGDTWRGDARAA
jgi:EAL domain-containing protein (putative c-di-GMP-specific phosphodiesterase class I)